MPGHIIYFIYFAFISFFINIASICQICSVFAVNHLQYLFCFLSVFKIDFVSKYIEKTDVAHGVYLHIFQSFFTKIVYYVSISHPRPHFQNQIQNQKKFFHFILHHFSSHFKSKITINLSKSLR